MANIIWKDTEYYNYEVSNTGLIRNKKTNKILKVRKRTHTKYAYYDMVVSVRYNNKSKIISVAREVAKAFVDNTDNKPCVDHIDTDTTNNNASNLRWCTLKEILNNKNTRYNRGKYYPVKCNETGDIMENVDDLIKFFDNRMAENTCKYAFWRHMKGQLKTFGGYTFTSIRKENNNG